MTSADLQIQIAKRQRAITRFEEKAARCNADTVLGRAVASRAERAATHHRKVLGKLQNQLKDLGE
jgi:hypothetical protein